MSDLREINDLLLEQLADKFPTKSSFTIWFGNFELLELTNEKAVFRTQTDLKKGIIEKRYMDILCQSLETVIGFPVKIEITAPPPGGVDIPIIDDTPAIAPTEEDKKEADERKNMINSLCCN